MAEGNRRSRQHTEELIGTWLELGCNMVYLGMLYGCLLRCSEWRWRVVTDTYDGQGEVYKAYVWQADGWGD